MPAVFYPYTTGGGSLSFPTLSRPSYATINSLALSPVDYNIPVTRAMGNIIQNGADWNATSYLAIVRNGIINAAPANTFTNANDFDITQLSGWFYPSYWNGLLDAGSNFDPGANPYVVFYATLNDLYNALNIAHIDTAVSAAKAAKAAADQAAANQAAIQAAVDAQAALIARHAALAQQQATADAQALAAQQAAQAAAATQAAYQSAHQAQNNAVNLFDSDVFAALSGIAPRDANIPQAQTVYDNLFTQYATRYPQWFASNDYQPAPQFDYFTLDPASDPAAHYADSQNRWQLVTSASSQAQYNRFASAMNAYNPANAQDATHTHQGFSGSWWNALQDNRVFPPTQNFDVLALAAYKLFKTTGVLQQLDVIGNDGFASVPRFATWYNAANSALVLQNSIMTRGNAGQPLNSDEVKQYIFNQFYRVRQPFGEYANGAEFFKARYAVVPMGDGTYEVLPNELVPAAQGNEAWAFSFLAAGMTFLGLPLSGLFNDLIDPGVFNEQISGVQFNSGEFDSLIQNADTGSVDFSLTPTEPAPLPVPNVVPVAPAIAPLVATPSALDATIAVGRAVLPVLSPKAGKLVSLVNTGSGLIDTAASIADALNTMDFVTPLDTNAPPVVPVINAASIDNPQQSMVNIQTMPLADTIDTNGIDLSGPIDSTDALVLNLPDVMTLDPDVTDFMVLANGVAIDTLTAAPVGYDYTSQYQLYGTPAPVANTMPPSSDFVQSLDTSAPVVDYSAITSGDATPNDPYGIQAAVNNYANNVTPETPYIAPDGTANIINASGAVEPVTTNDNGQVITFVDDNGNVFISTPDSAFSIPPEDDMTAGATVVVNKNDDAVLTDNANGQTFSFPAASQVGQVARQVLTSGRPSVPPQTMPNGAVMPGKPAVSFPDNAYGLAASIASTYAQYKTSQNMAALQQYRQSTGGFKTLANGQVVRTNATGQPIGTSVGSLSQNTILLGVAALLGVVLIAGRNKPKGA